MYFQYGNYRHAAGEVEFKSQPPETVFSAAGIATGVRYRWELAGRLHGADAAALTAAIAALEAAYSVQGLDAGLYEDDGTPTAHVLHTAACWGGVRIVQPPAYPVGTGGQYTTYRDYVIGIEATTQPITGPGLFDWKESLGFAGGGPVFVYKVPRRGPPQRQQVTEADTYKATQDGEAASALSYPTPASPQWPNDWHREGSNVTYHTPERSGGQGQGSFRYRTSWHYVFESANEMHGLPTPAPF